MHSPTESSFDITADSQSIGSFSFNHQVGNEWLQISSEKYIWEEVLESLQAWARQVVEWEDTPDLWKDRHGWRDFVNLQHESDVNSPFTLQERDLISSQLKAIKETVKQTYELTAAQEAKIDERIKEAEEASGRLGRKDWVLLFMGGVFSLILTDAITPDIAQHILMMALHGLEHLFLGRQSNIRGTLNK